ncbi:MAG: RsmE family RNA methyltransferase [Candidatus Spyradocola sp.]|jgi:16S rRNA (uracil1498-N3)-methyltransferase
MHRFFSEDGAIRGEELKHLRQVLRLAPGAQVEILRGGRRYLAELTSVGPEEARYAEQEELPDNEPLCRVTLYQGLCKGEKMDFLVQKCTEMGVSAVVPVEMARSVARADRAEKKTERYARIAREAVKQCGRARVPEILPAMGFAEALQRMRGHELLLMPYEEGGRPFDAPIRARSVGLLIGPEGGIAPEEAEAVRGIGGVPVTLGSRILRTETAGLVALTLALHAAGDLGGGQ